MYTQKKSDVCKGNSRNNNLSDPKPPKPKSQNNPKKFQLRKRDV